MPEGVEVTVTSLYLCDVLKDDSVVGINVLSGRYSRHPMKGIDSFKKKLPMKVKSVESKGKFMWFELEDTNNDDFYILNTFGLEGSWGFTKKENSNVELLLSSGRCLFFTDPRNFGTIVMTSIKKQLIDKLNGLGSDLLKESFTNDDFNTRLLSYLTMKSGMSEVRKNKKIVQILMNQTVTGGIGSGIGNYLVAEILYNSKISPHKTVYDIYINKDLSNKLATAIKYVMKLSFMTSTIGYFCKVDKDMEKWIKNMRKNVKYNYHPEVNLENNKFKFYIYRQKEDPKKHRIKADTNIIKGRSTYWCSQCQH